MSNERPRRARPRSTSGPEAQLVYGVHPVMEILRQRPGSVERVFAIREKGPGLGRVLRTARVAGIPITYLSRALLARRVGGGAVHQGIAAQVAPVPYRETEEICSIAAARKDGMLVLLDRVVDPRNLGAALRTCAAAGVTGVIVGSEGSAGLGPAAVKTSAGAVERIPVAREPRPAWRLERLREQGFEVLGLDPRGPDTWDRLDLKGRIVLVAGGEGRGLRPGLARACDRRVSIPLAPGIESLNVTVSLGVLLFEALRQRRQPGSGP